MWPSISDLEKQLLRINDRYINSRIAAEPPVEFSNNADS